MHSSSILPSPHGVETDGAARPGSTLGPRIRRAGLAIWRALEASGQARARRELRTLHGHWEMDDLDVAGGARDGVRAAPVHPHR